MDFKKYNVILGWVSFAIATFVYVSTMEPTASFWDCGEFIATSYKLQVGHPPGAPLFLMIGRFFSMFASPENAAYMVNLISALSSSFTILFLFWTITYFGRKIAEKNGGLEGKELAVLGSGLVGALAYTFSDTFWFSAVEAEVYAMSSLFTAIVFWAILKWESVADERGSNRWILFIAYMMGLSIGVHLLNLLAIPALTFVYYFKKYKVTRKGVIITSLVSIVILGFVQKGIIPGLVNLASKFELMFVNGMGMPLNSGILIYGILIIGLMAYAIYYTQKKKQVLYNTILLCVSVIIIGYSSYALIFIRSSANTPMDENNPENVFTLLSYLNREQYGSQPLLYGQYFNSPLDKNEPYVDGNPVYWQDKEKGKYIISDDKKKSEPNYASEFKTIFPRMWSPDGKHVKAYKKWSNFEGKPIRYPGANGQNQIINKPTFGENLTFFFSHQISWMYIRYFLWNFAGRQNDIQGHGGISDGNWISGIPFIDSMRLGDQSNLPASLENNPARNKYYFLPLLLGLIGLFFHYKNDKKDFAVTTMLFFFTGLAIILYLNQYPFQPRERDYAYAGSFYAFAIWIGLGVYGIVDALQKNLKMDYKMGAITSTAVCLLLVPGLMAKDGWNDHDRSKRYTARDIAKAYLDSCEKDAILFTNGDNDTFPLWYVQEVEEYRTDIKVINLSLLNTDWYIDQMRKATYESKPAPFSIPPEKYRQGTRDYVPIVTDKNTNKFMDVKQAVNFITNESKKAMFSSDKRLNYLPTKKFSLKVDKEKVLANGTVPQEKANEIVDDIRWKINKNYILKKDMMILDLIANNNWERPVYFAITTGSGAYIGMDDYFQLEGLAYRLVPFKTKNSDGQTGYVNTEIMFDNLMNKFSYGNMEDTSVYMDENNRRMCMNLRNNFARLAGGLIDKGDNTRAKETLDRCLEVMPDVNIPYNFFMLPVAENYYRLGDNESGNKIVSTIFNRMVDELDYYFDLKPKHYSQISDKAQQALSIIYQLNVMVNQRFPQEELGGTVQGEFNRLQNTFSTKNPGA